MKALIKFENLIKIKAGSNFGWHLVLGMPRSASLWPGNTGIAEPDSLAPFSHLGL